MKALKILIFATIGFLSTSLISCEDKSSGILLPNSNIKGQASVEITDAAVAFENVSGVYLAIDKIQAFSQGKIYTVASFDSPKIINLMDYQNGNTYNLGSGDLEVGTYSNMTFVISSTADSYIKMKDGTSQTLNTEGGSNYVVNGAFKVTADNTTDLVADIDLRKALVYNENSTFVLRGTARLVDKSMTGTIHGHIDMPTVSEEVVIYAYHKGQYTDSEIAEPAIARTRFENAVNSAVVTDNGEYTLAFMEEGEYELIVANYENPDGDNHANFIGMLNVDILFGGVLLNSVTVDSNATIELNLKIN